MKGSSLVSRFGRVRLLIAMFIASLFVVPASSAVAADVIANPGPFTAKITGGNLGIREFDVPVEELSPSPTLSGTMNADGTFVIPSSGVVFPALVFEVEPGVEVNVFVRPASSNWTGTLNPDTGDFEIDARIRVQATGEPLGVNLGNSCFVGDAGTNNIHLNPATSGTVPANPPAPSLTGAPYDSESGKVTVVNNTASVPGASGCGPLGLASGVLDDALGLPSPSGNNRISLELEFPEKFRYPLVARYSASTTDGRVPVEVDFDASASSSDLGPISEYIWDFNDGSDPVVTTDPTISYTYDVPGVYRPTLSIEAGGIDTFPRSRATITARGVVTTLDQRPPAFSQSRDATFTWSANEEVDRFDCRLDVNGVADEWEECESPLEYENLADADYVFRVAGVQPEGRGLAAVHAFRVDNIPPVITIDSRPPNPTNTTSGPVAFSSNEPGTSFECRYLPVSSESYDPETIEFQPCSSPFQADWDGVDEGVNIFQVRGTDRAGNLSAPVQTSWTVDVRAPQTTVTPPPGPTNQIGGVYTEVCSAGTGLAALACAIGLAPYFPTYNNGNNPAQSFQFTADETVTFECQFNDGPIRPCNSGIQTGAGLQVGQGSGTSNGQQAPTGDANAERLGNPIEGTNTLRLWATDVAGNRSEPAISTYVYDTIRAQATALAAPAPFTKDRDQTVIFEANEPIRTSPAGFECRVINNTGSGTTSFANNVTGYSACSPGRISSTLGWYRIAGQTDGRKGVQIRPIDLAGNVAANNTQVLNEGVTVYWTVDNAAPTTTIASAPQQGSNTESTSATIGLTAADTPINFGVTANGIPAQQPAYECSLNGEEFESCSTPIQLSGLEPGEQSFRVRTNDQAGNTSAVVERKWTVVGEENASVSLNTKPGKLVNTRNNTFAFEPSNGTSQCRVNPTEANNSAGTGWTSCPDGTLSLTGQADGTYRVEIRADATSVPAIYDYAVFASEPVVSFAGIQSGVAGSNQYGFGRVRDGIRYTPLSISSQAIPFSVPANPGYAPGSATFECRYYFEGQTPEPGFSACTSPYQASWNPQRNGRVMKLEVRPTSSTGVVGPVQTTSWTIVNTKPDIALGTGGTIDQLNETISGTTKATACGTGAVNTWPFGGCVAIASSTQPAPRTNQTTAIRFQAVSSKPLANAVGFACQLNNNPVQDPCTGRTSGTFNPLTVVMNTGRATNNDNIGFAPVNNAQNTFKVWAVDEAGNYSDDHEEYTWTHDNTIPGFAIDTETSAPRRTNAQDVVVNINANEDLSPDGAAGGFKCRLIENISEGSTANATATNTWPSCTNRIASDKSQWVGSGLAEGNYGLDIRGYDLLNQVQTGTANAQRPATTDNSVNGRRFFFTVDRTAPGTNITGGPAANAVVGAKSGEIAFTVTGLVGAEQRSSECRLNPDDPADLETGWEDCTSPYSFEGLEDGEQLFQVRSTDQAGNTQANPTTRSWTINTTKPTVDLESSIQGDLTNEDSVTFRYETDPADADTECRLIGPGEDAEEVQWGACEGSGGARNILEEDPDGGNGGQGGLVEEDPEPKNLLELAESVPDLSTLVAAVEAAGLTEALASEGPLTVFAPTNAAFNALPPGVLTDLLKPENKDQLIEILTYHVVAAKALSGELTNGQKITTLQGDTVEVTIEGGTVKINGATVVIPDVEATNGVAHVIDQVLLPRRSVTYEDLTDGEWTFEIRAVNSLDVTGDAESVTWTIDTIAPQVQILTGPSGSVGAGPATFTFASGDPDVESFTCQLNENTPTPCTSPVTYPNPANGQNTFRVFATDEAGNESETAERAWNVDNVTPVATITSGPEGETTSTAASFAFSSSKGGSTFECSLDGGSFEACTSPKEYTGLALGDHTFKVRARDAVNNLSAEVTREWKVVPVPVEPRAVFGNVSFAKTKATVKRGKKVSLTIRVKNTGDAAGNATVALSATGKSVKVPKSVTINIRPGETGTAKITVTATNKKGSGTISASLAGKTARAKVTVK